jgi:hypothetical protein
MSSLREIYELPDRPPIPYRVWALMLVVLAMSLGLWLLLPDSTVAVVILFVAVTTTVFMGVWHVLASRDLEEPPPPNPVPPPSVRRP